MSSKLHLVVNIIATKPKKLIQSKTGGANRLIEILRRLQRHSAIQIHIIAPRWILNQFKQNHLQADYIEIKSCFEWKHMVGLVMSSLMLCIQFWFFIKKLRFRNDRNIVIYSSSDLFWEVIPAFFWKLQNKESKWLQIIYHTYPPWHKRAGNRLQNLFGFYLQRLSFFLIRNRTDKVIVLNKFVRNQLQQLGFKKNQIILSMVGVNINHINRIRRNRINYDGVFLGRLSYSKGILELIQIWENVCKKNLNYKLGIIGGDDPVAKKEMELEIKKRKLDHSIALLGFLEDEEAFSIMKSSKVFLFPSHEEGWGMAIAEAMSCKIPVVAWDLPVYKEVYQDKIFQVKENDIKSFSQKVIDLLADVKLRKKIGYEGYSFIKKYSWDMVFQKELTIIQSLYTGW